MKSNETTVPQEILAGKVKDFNILKSSLALILKRIHELSGCQCVAIRLKENGDFPYFVYKGFPEFFIHKENSLNVRDSEGNLIIDDNNTPFMECMCGNVLKRRFNPNFSFFTEKGSFWTNSTTELLATLTKEERQEVGRTRDTCHKYGYESVALIPIQGKGEPLGLIQFNDPRKDMFTSEKIEKYQLIAEHVRKVILNILEFTEQMSQIFNLTSKVQKQ